jgi:glutathione peroxidase
MNDAATATTVYDFEAQTLQGKPVRLADYRGKVLLVVNTASQCGLTPQYEGLEALHRDYAPRGLVVLGFPCNQFGGQEPGDAADIESFCSLNYGVSFPMMAKIDVNGPQAHPLFQWLTKQKSGLFGSEAIKWNFTKFLVDREGRVQRRYAPTVLPKDLRADIEALLG